MVLAHHIERRGARRTLFATLRQQATPRRRSQYHERVGRRRLDKSTRASCARAPDAPWDGRVHRREVEIRRPEARGARAAPLRDRQGEALRGRRLARRDGPLPRAGPRAPPRQGRSPRRGRRLPRRHLRRKVVRGARARGRDDRRRRGHAPRPPEARRRGEEARPARRRRRRLEAPAFAKAKGKLGGERERARRREPDVVGPVSARVGGAGSASTISPCSAFAGRTSARAAVASDASLQVGAGGARGASTATSATSRSKAAA